MRPCVSLLVVCMLQQTLFRDATQIDGAVAAFLQAAKRSAAQLIGYSVGSMQHAACPLLVLSSWHLLIQMSHPWLI